MSHVDNEVLAFGLVVGAGAATALGASVVFIPWAVKYATRKTLAGALGLSAGVMMYVSFVEIFHKSLISFMDAGFKYETAYMYATVCFFGGVIFMVLLNSLVTRLLRRGHNIPHSHGSGIDAPTDTANRTTSNTASQQSSDLPIPMKDGNFDIPCPCHSEDPAKDLETLQQMATIVQENQLDRDAHDHGDHDHHSLSANANTVDELHRSESSVAGEEGELQQQQQQENDEYGEHDKAKLMRMSINTAIAIGLHNFPEGLATFVATVNDPRVGTVLAIAIAIHNIPEGLCVAMPIYYATGKRWNAFAWACLSGASEPIAALLGWAILANSFGDTLYAVLFGMVGGMMVIISVRELLPTAYRYDTEDCVVTYSFIGGMMVMAFSLVLFVEA